MTVSATLTTIKDRREKEPFIKPVWEHKMTFVWQTDDGHAAQNITLNELNGVIMAVVANISSVTGNPTVSITLRDAHSAAILADTVLATLADGTVHYKSSPTNFDEIPVNGDVVVSVDPSADAGGAAQTLTVIVVLKGL